MRIWQYFQPGDNDEVVTTTVTDEEIIATYWPWWKQRMEELGRHDLISYENCIADWVTVHWAEQLSHRKQVP